MVRLIPLAEAGFGCSLPQTELGASWRGMEGGRTLRKTFGVAEGKAKGSENTARCGENRLKGG